MPRKIRLTPDSAHVAGSGACSVCARLEYSAPPRISACTCSFRTFAPSWPRSTSLPWYQSWKRGRLLQFLAMRPILFCVVTLGLFAQDQQVTRALQSSRQRIDRIDDQSIKLLNDRAAVVHEVGLIKKRFHAPASTPGREEQVLQRVSDQARSPLTSDAVRKIYKTLLAEMTAMEDREMQSQAK